MRCTSYCTAASYDIPKLVKKLIADGYEPKYFDDVIYVHREAFKSSKGIDIIYFSFGCVIIWGADISEEKIICDGLEAVSIDISDNPQSDLIYFRNGNKHDNTYIDEEKNEIILHDNSHFIKLSISHALAQSVKLNILEYSVKELLANTSNIQQELAKTGTVSLSKKEISKKIGMLFNERYRINMHSDILDLPEFFWRRPRYEPLYHMAAEFQDIKVRQDIMHHRLDMVHELYGILSNERNYIHSTRLEVIIIVLITIEVIMGVVNTDFFTKILSMF